MPELFLIRHAIALPAEPGQLDELRALSGEGRERMMEVAAGLAALGVELDELVHSPLLRAVETAELLTDLCTGETRVDEGLAQPPRAELLHRIQGASAALVGHEPWMSDLLALVLGCPTAAPALTFKKGGVAWLEGELEPGAMRLRAFLPPRVTRRLR